MILHWNFEEDSVRSGAGLKISLKMWGSNENKETTHDSPDGKYLFTLITGVSCILMDEVAQKRPHIMKIRISCTWPNLPLTLPTFSFVLL